ncbi:MAG TPA: dual specificity protein phosphatase family protein [Kofleriaceae bacterium]|nr:dual specificity protein phosphatase family protein [Kofleriaceae bacterium]
MASRVLPLIAAACIGLAIWTRLWILLWPAAVLIAVAIIYLAPAPAAFGKRPDGTIAWWAWLLWAPIFGYMRLLHELARTVTDEPVASEVAPGVWVGRRPRPHELPAGVAIVVDLCAELPEPAAVVRGRAYLAIPTLDATSPTPARIADAVDAMLAAASTGGAAFIHCAFGHGRSATVAAALLVRRGDATLEDVEQQMRARRPRIGLNAHQRDALAAAVRLGATRPSSRHGDRRSSPLTEQ